MKFKNKYTNEIVEASNNVELFAFSHNSNYEIVEVTKEEKPKADTKKKKEEKPKADVSTTEE